MRTILLTIALAAAAIAPALANQRPETKRDIPYSEPAAPATSLDVYVPPTGQDHPILVWIHGGGWQIGDKARVQNKPAAFNAHGFVFVSINYRLHPAANYQEQAADVARALRWVHDHAGEFGGDPRRIFVGGHSAGAHLAALVATDPRYLAAEEMKLSDLAGVILLDGAGYDVPRQIELSLLPRMKQMYLTVFGDDVEKQRDASPIAHVAAGNGTPPFLILHIASRRDARIQSQALAEKLTAAGAAARVVSAADKTHATINRDLGQQDDPPTEAVFEFLDSRLKELSQ